MRIGVRVVLLVVALFFVTKTFSQDLIVKQNGDEIQVSVANVGEYAVQYYAFSDTSKAIQTVSLSDVFMIKYANGDKRVFNQPVSASKTANASEREYDIKGTWQQIVNGVALQNYIQIVVDYEVLKVSFFTNPTPTAEYQIKQKVADGQKIPNTYSADGFSKTTFTLLSETVLVYETYGEKREYRRCKGLDFAQPVQEDLNRKNLSAYNRRGLFINGSVGYKSKYLKDSGTLSNDFAVEFEFRLGKNVGLGFLWENSKGNTTSGNKVRVDVFATRFAYHVPVRRVLDPYAGVTAMYHFVSFTNDQGKTSNLDAIKFGGFVGVRVIVFFVGGFVEYHYNTCAPVRVGACFTF